MSARLIVHKTANYCLKRPLSSRLAPVHLAHNGSEALTEFVPASYHDSRARLRRLDSAASGPIVACNNPCGHELRQTKVINSLVQ